ncbi:hypothetical protein QA601_09295 [Chitinispirillales bacterium ANBcel5]|uniref:hypothetical protein n=1 Tax=Cellulosispirillum alkaliphilum TaxID=3039283 RepID=UPI002A529FCB|nr:hypothetical protein [Chitinispirillales bacterium ANBcel5]
MESAALVYTTLLVVVLQLITIALVLSIKKRPDRNYRDSKTRHPKHNNTRQEKRGNDFRKNKKSPHHDNRKKSGNQNSQQKSSAVDPVEKSLRDINLKLKNAERDQENARRQIQSGASKENQRKGNRKNHNKNNDQNRNRRSNWQERNNRKDGSKKQAGKQEESSATPHQKPASEPAPAVNNPTDSGIKDVPASEDTQHGRKFVVKRRQMKDSGDTETPTSDNSSDTNSSQDILSDKNDGVTETEKVAEGEIKFGRR